MTNIYTWFMIFMFMFFMLIFMLMTQTHSTPIAMIIILIFYTLSISMFMSLMNCKYIFSIILYLMMISGLLIIFLYFTSLINNEQFKWKNNYFLMTIFIMNMIMMSYLMSRSMKISLFPMILTNNSSMCINQNINTTQIITYIYNYPFNVITILSILFLLLTLFIIIKICLLKMKSLRMIKK